MKRLVDLGIVLLLLAGLAAGVGGESLATFEGHGVRFEYPANWDVEEWPTGFGVSDGESFVLSISVHDEGCYPLSYHPYLMDYMLKLWGDPRTNVVLHGTPRGEPIIEYMETVAGPYSAGTQAYENPPQMLLCELQGYSEGNVTIAYATSVFDLAKIQKANLDLGRLKMSLVITEKRTNPLVRCNDSEERGRSLLIEALQMQI
jgi:hypothetical protein